MEKIKVMVAGLSSDPDSGKMARLVAEAIVSQEDVLLYPSALSERKGVVQINSSTEVRLIPFSDHANVLESCTDVDVIVDFTLPTSINLNAELYCAKKIPFIMGTTGGHRQLLIETVKNSNVSAVIATNMAVPIVVFQAMIHFAAANFPGSFKGFRLVIRESHQAQKVDPSGTAASLLDSFAALGMPLKKEQIIMVRDPVVQEVEMGVPKAYLGGHGYHTYTLLSPDNTISMQFKHNVLGQSVYVDGTLKAIRFLAKHKQEKGKVFSMVDVLKG